MSRTIVRTCTSEFQLSNCGYDHSPVDDFVRSQWQSRTKSPYYLAYRWLVAIAFTVSWVFSWYGNTTAADWGYYFLYFTNWGINICLLTTLFGAILVTIWYWHPEFSENVLTLDAMPRSFKTYWIMHNTTVVAAFVITIIYWGLLYDAAFSTLSASNILVHATNACIMFLDLLIVAYPIRLFHIVTPFLLGIVYTIFGVVFYVAGATDRGGNRYIYNILDWSNPGAAVVTTVGVFVLMAAMHFFVFWIHHLRMFVHRKFFMTSVDLEYVASPVESGKQMHDNLAFNLSNEKLAA